MTRYVYQVKLTRQHAPQTATFEIEIDINNDFYLQDEIDEAISDYVDSNDVDWKPSDFEDIEFEVEIIQTTKLEIVK